MLTRDQKTIFSSRKAALAELEANAARAAGLSTYADDMRRDLKRLEARRDMFAAFGEGKAEVPQAAFIQKFGCVIEFEPLRSQLTGNELAAKVEASCEHLRGEIAKAMTEIEQLLADQPTSSKRRQPAA